MGGGGDEDPRDERVPFEWVLTCDHRATTTCVCALGEVEGGSVGKHPQAARFRISIIDFSI